MDGTILVLKYESPVTPSNGSRDLNDDCKHAVVAFVIKSISYGGNSVKNDEILFPRQ